MVPAKATSMIPVAAAFIRNGTSFLIARRAAGELKGKWEFPGGKIESGETPEHAIRREIKEELGLTIAVVRYLSAFDYSYSFADIHATVLECTIAGSPEIRLTDSHTAIAWISLSGDVSCTGHLDIPDFAPLDREIYQYVRQLYGESYCSGPAALHSAV